MTVSVIPSPVLCPRPVHDATTRIEVILFSIATYLDRGSQARGMTEAGRGVAGIIPWRLSFCIYRRHHNYRLLPPNKR